MKNAVAALLALLSAVPALAQTPDQQKWNDAVQAGKREGKVVVVGSPDPVMRNQIIPAFTARYGIQVEYVAGSSGTIASRIKVERGSNLYSVDIYMAGNDTTANVLYADKMIDPLKPLMVQAETIDPSKWKAGKLTFVDPQEQYILRLFRTVANALFINADQVKPDELKSVQDLVNPRWKGKISTEDPTAPGSGIAGAGKFYNDMGPEFVKKLYIDQAPLFTRDRRMLSDSLARGIYPICITCRADDVAELQKSGFNIVEVYALDGLPGRVRGGPFFLTLANKAPHPHAAQVFANWVASKEALEIYSRVYGEVTLRNDVDESFLNPEWIPRPGITYRDEANFEWITSGRKESMDKARALLKR